MHNSTISCNIHKCVCVYICVYIYIRQIQSPMSQTMLGKDVLQRLAPSRANNAFRSILMPGQPFAYAGLYCIFVFFNSVCCFDDNTFQFNFNCTDTKNKKTGDITLTSL